LYDGTTKHCRFRQDAEV